MNFTPYSRTFRAKVYPYLFTGGNTGITGATVQTDDPILGVPISFPTHNMEYVPGKMCDLFNVKSWQFTFSFNDTGTGFVGSAKSFLKTVNTGTYVYFDTATGLPEETFNGMGWETQRARFEANWVIPPLPATQPPVGYDAHQATVNYVWREVTALGEEEVVGCLMTVPLISTARNAEELGEIRHFYNFRAASYPDLGTTAYGYAFRYDYSGGPAPVEFYASPGLMFDGAEHMKVDSHFTIEIDPLTYY